MKTKMMMCNVAFNCPHSRLDKAECPHARPHYTITTCGVNKFGRGVGHGGCIETFCTGVLPNKTKQERKND